MPKSKKNLTELHERFSLHYSDSFGKEVEEEFVELKDKSHCKSCKYTQTDAEAKKKAEKGFLEPKYKGSCWICNHILSDEEVKKTYGANLRLFRELNNMSLESLGKALNLSQNAVKNIEKANVKGDIDPTYLKAFCFIFHTSPWTLLKPLPPPSKVKPEDPIPMVFYDDEKARWIRCTIQNLSSEDEDAIGNKLLSAFVKISKAKNSTLRKPKNQDGSKQRKPDLFADIVDIFDKIPNIPNPDTFKLDAHPSGYPVPLEWTGKGLSDAEFKEWYARKEQFFRVFDALSALYDRTPRLVRYLLCISFCDESVQIMAYQTLEVGGFLNKR